MIIKKNQHQKNVSRLAATLCVVVGCLQIASSAAAEDEKSPSSPATRKYQERQTPFVSAEFTKNTNAWKADNNNNTVVRFVPIYANATQFLDSKVDVVNPDGSVSKMTAESALHRHLETFEREMKELKKLKPHFGQLSGESDSSYETRMGRFWMTVKRAETAANSAKSLENSLMSKFTFSFGPATAVDPEDLKIPGATSTSEYRSFQDIRSGQLFTHQAFVGKERYKELLRSEALLNGNSDGSLVQPRVRLAERLAHIREIEKAGVETLVKNIRDTPKQIDPNSPDAKLLLAIEKQSLPLRRQIRWNLDRVPRERFSGGRITISVALGSIVLSNAASAGEAEPIDADAAAEGTRKQFDNSQSWARRERKISH